MKKVLTDRGLKALKPAEPGKRYMVWDATVPGFGARVTDKGCVTFVIMRRLNGKVLRRAIGSSWQTPIPSGKALPYPLDKAREAAREALQDVAKGVDPTVRRENILREEERRREDRFEVVAEDFIRRHVSKLRSGSEVAAAIRRELVTRWGKRPIVEITRRDVVKMLEEVVDSGRPYIAHHLLSYARKLFNWAIARDIYGLEASPCDRVAAKDIIGAREPRQRVLTDNELRALWKATSRTDNASGLDYPFAPLVQILLLTGQRLREVAGMTWNEIDFDKALWVIPANRMKGAAAHEVPLAQAVMAIFQSLPRWAGPYVFSTTSGQRPVSGFSRAKTRLDRMAGFADWRFHDLRRTCRTHLSGLPVPSNVCELVIGHAQPGLHRVYDLHNFRDEKRRALDLWADRLISIAEPREGNIISLRTAG